VICGVVDSIEANVENAAASVEEGSEQLRQARRHQVMVLCLDKRALQKSCLWPPYV